MYAVTKTLQASRMIQERESEAKRNKVSVEAGAWSVISQARSVPGTGTIPHDIVDTDRSVPDRYRHIRHISVDCCSCWLLQQRFSNRVLLIRYRRYVSYEADREQHQHQQIINKQRNSNVKVNIHTVPRPRYAIIARKRVITRSRYLVSVQVSTCPRIGSTKTCCESVWTKTIRSHSTKNLPAIVARTYVVGRSQPSRQYSINCQFRSKIGQVLSTSRKKRASHSET
jgi:hypothetical protein